MNQHHIHTRWTRRSEIRTGKIIDRRSVLYGAGPRAIQYFYNAPMDRVGESYLRRQLKKVPMSIQEKFKDFKTDEFVRFIQVAFDVMRQNKRMRDVGVSDVQVSDDNATTIAGALDFYDYKIRRRAYSPMGNPVNFKWRPKESSVRFQDVLRRLECIMRTEGFPDLKHTYAEKGDACVGIDDAFVLASQVQQWQSSTPRIVGTNLVAAKAAQEQREKDRRMLGLGSV